MDQTRGLAFGRTHVDEQTGGVIGHRQILCNLSHDKRWHRPCVVARLTAALYARAVGCATFATLSDTNFAERDVAEEI